MNTHGCGGKLGVTQDLLRFYYDRFFPFDLIAQWLSLSKETESLENREFSLAVSRKNDNYYLRYQSFSNPQSFRSRILSLETLPHKIDAGAHYSIPPRNKDITRFNSKCVPIEKELVFDIDMNDYDDVRSCCQGKAVCPKCWTLLATAADVLDQSLRNDFGFKHILWVFSGRRGLHGWISDPAARTLPSDGRASLVDYLSLVTGSTNQIRKVRLFGNVPHPFVRRSYEICLPHFEKLLVDQKLFDRGSATLNMVDEYMSNASSDVKDKYFHHKASRWNGTSQNLWDIVLASCLPRDKVTPIEIVLSLCYPRLDVNVSKDITHLLKLPFCIHEATGKICVPLPRHELLNFDPNAVPTLYELYDQYVKGKVEPALLQPYLNYFRSSVVEPLLITDTSTLNVTKEPPGISTENDEQLEEVLFQYPQYRGDISHELLHSKGKEETTHCSPISEW